MIRIIRRNQSTFVDSIAKLAKNGHADSAISLYRASVNRSEIPRADSQQLMRIFSRIRHAESPAAVQELMTMSSGNPNRQEYPPSLYLCLAQSLALNNRISEARSYLSILERGERTAEMDIMLRTMFTSLIVAHSRAGDMAGVKASFEEMKAKRIPTSIAVYETLIRSCKLNKRPDMLKWILDELKAEPDLPISAEIFNSLLLAMPDLADSKFALTVLTEMEAYGVKPTSDTFQRVIMALCFDAKSSIEDIKKVLAEMHRLAIAPTALTYANLASAFIDRKLVVEEKDAIAKLLASLSIDILEGSPIKGHHPQIYVALLRHYRRESNVHALKILLKNIEGMQMTRVLGNQVKASKVTIDAQSKVKTSVSV